MTDILLEGGLGDGRMIEWNGSPYYSYSEMPDLSAQAPSPLPEKFTVERHTYRFDRKRPDGLRVFRHCP